MNEKRELLDLLEIYIKHVKKVYEKNNPFHFDEEAGLNLTECIEKINDNLNELVNLDMSKVRKLFPSFNEWQLELLDYYQIILRDTEFKLQDDDYKMLETVLVNLSSNVEKYMREIQECKTKKDRELEKLISPYKLIIKKINRESSLKSEDIQIIYKIIKQSNKKVEDSMRLMKYLSLLSLNNMDCFMLDVDSNMIDNDNKYTEVLDSNDNLYETLRKLFIKYDIYFNKFSENEQKQIQKYGNLDNIEQIIKKFLSYDINLSKYMDTKCYALTNIFLYSNDKIIDELLSTFIKYNILVKENDSIDISILLDNSFRFLSKNKKWVKKDSLENSIIEIDSLVGCFEDVISNLKYFYNEDIDIVKEYFINSSSFDLPHEQILKAVDTFNLYGIDKKYYLNNLDCFNSTYQADIIDMFLETGHFDYLKDNMLEVLRTVDSSLFYKLVMANQLGLTPEMYEDKFVDDILCDDREYLGITGFNNGEMVKQYLFNFDGKEYYDELVRTKINNKINIVFHIEKDLIDELDKKYLMLDEKGYLKNRLYNIDGVFISRTKFLRIYNTLLINGIFPSFNCIIYALTKNSIITKEEFDKIYNNISDIYNELDR